MNNEEKIIEMLTRMDGRLNKLAQGQSQLEQGLVKLQEDVEMIKEDVAATKATVNIIGNWAEHIEAIHNVGLYK